MINTKLEKIRNIPVIGWIVGHWMVIVALFIAIYAYKSGTLALSARGALLIPIFALMVRAASTLMTSISQRGVIGDFRRSDAFDKAFNEMTPFQKILICKIGRWLWVIVCAMIACATLILININVTPLS